jgi:3-oxoacyl-[acyl-carrier protein] reductase
MNLELANKTVLITGASSGIGAATARVFAEEGADVVISYNRNREGAHGVLEAVRSRGRQGWLCQMNVSDADNVSHVIGQLRDVIEGLDVLILCAGYNIIQPFDQIAAADWDKVIDINLNGPFYVLQACTPLFRDGASVVTVASVAAHTGAPQHPHYAAAKAGLVNLTKSAARILAPKVRVNCVAPGIALTPMGEDTVGSLPPDYVQKKLLTERFATPEEIANCIVFVASPVTRFMTGATIDINGGRELR